MENTTDNIRYRCVICHVPEDQGWANWLNKELSSYAIPKNLVGNINRRGEEIFANLKPVYSLVSPESDNISEDYQKIFQEVDFVVVVCSPWSAQSEGLGACIRFLKSHGKADRLIAVIVDGLPNATNFNKPSEECFHSALRYEVNAQGLLTTQLAEPLAADFRAEGIYSGWFDLNKYKDFLNDSGLSQSAVNQKAELQRQRLHLMKLKVIAGIVAINLGELTERDKAYQAELYKKKRLQYILILGFGLLLLLVGYLGMGRIREYNHTAQTAAEAEKVAIQRSENAIKNQSEIENARIKQAELLTAVENRIKGLNYLNGSNGFEKNRAQALNYLRISAKSGDSIAQLNLAKLLINNKRFADEETKEGIALLEKLGTKSKSVESGAALLMLGELNLSESKITDQDKTLGYSLIEKASRIGHAPAMLRLAHLLESGQVGTPRINEALFWYEKSAKAGDADALFQMYTIYSQGNNSLGVSPDSLKAKEYLIQAANAGSFRAQYNYANTLTNPVEIYKLLDQSAQSGFLPARVGLAKMYLFGEHGQITNLEIGIRHVGLGLDLAIDQNDMNQIKILVDYLIQAKVLSQCQSIRSSLKKSVEIGCPNAAYVYAMTFCTLDGKLEDTQLFSNYIQKATVAGLADAQYDYGYQIISGNIPNAKVESGVLLIELAAAQGHKSALSLAIKIRSEGN